MSFVTVEGIEGSGKTTQVALLADALVRAGHSVCRTREPGGTPVGVEIRRLLLDSPTPISPLAELLLLLADRAEHVSETIQPALSRGEIVLCDRFSESTIAYQAYGRGLPLDVVESLERAARSECMPNVTFVLDCPVEIGLDRTRSRRGSATPDRFESEDREFHERVRRGFLDRATRSPERITVVDAERSPEELHEEILASCLERVGRRAS